MKHHWTIALVSTLVACSAPQFSLGATIDFESIPTGTIYGTPEGDLPGDVVLSQDGIDMSVEQFSYPPYVGFNHAEVGGQFAPFFPTQPLELNNISVVFDFANVGFDVSEVTFEFTNFGGTDNFAVNGGTVIVLDSLANLPANVGPGVTASVDGFNITLTGPITSFRVGGQELVVDTIVGIPEPATILLLGLGGVLVVRRQLRRVR